MRGAWHGEGRWHAGGVIPAMHKACVLCLWVCSTHTHVVTVLLAENILLHYYRARFG